MSSPANQPAKSPSVHRALVVAGGTIAMLAGLWLLLEYRSIVLATLVGVGGGVLIAPIINWLKQRMRMPRGLGGLVVALLLAAVAAGIGYALYVMLAGQAARLAENWPQISSDLVDRIEELQGRLPGFDNMEEDMPVDGALEKAGSLLMQGLSTGVTAVAGLLVVVMVGLFTAVNSDSYFRGFLTLFPKHRRARIATLGRGAAGVIRQWFFAHLLVTVASGTIVAVAFWIIGIDYWLLLGVLTAALDFIPYVGAILTGAAACLVTLGTQPEKLWWVLATYIAVQQIEGDVMMPLIMKGNIRLPEAHLLIFILLMGVAFGFVGMLVAAPLFAVLHYWYVNAYVPWTNHMTASQSRAAAD